MTRNNTRQPITWLGRIGNLTTSAISGFISHGWQGGAVSLTATAIDELLISKGYLEKHYLSTTAFWSPVVGTTIYNIAYNLAAWSLTDMPLFIRAGSAYSTAPNLGLGHPTVMPWFMSEGPAITRYSITATEIIKKLPYYLNFLRSPMTFLPGAVALSYLGHDPLDYHKRTDKLDILTLLIKLFDGTNIITSREELYKVYHLIKSNPYEGIKLAVNDLYHISQNKILLNVTAKIIIDLLEIHIRDLWCTYPIIEQIMKFSAISPDWLKTSLSSGLLSLSFQAIESIFEYPKTYIDNNLIKSISRRTQDHTLLNKKHLEEILGINSKAAMTNFSNDLGEFKIIAWSPLYIREVLNIISNQTRSIIVSKKLETDVPELFTMKYMLGNLQNTTTAANIMNGMAANFSLLQHPLIKIPYFIAKDKLLNKYYTVKGIKPEKANNFNSYFSESLPMLQADKKEVKPISIGQNASVAFLKRITSDLPQIAQASVGLKESTIKLLKELTQEETIDGGKETNKLIAELESTNFNSASNLSIEQKKKIGIILAIFLQPKILFMSKVSMGLEEQSLIAAKNLMTKYLPNTAIIDLDSSSILGGTSEPPE